MATTEVQKTSLQTEDVDMVGEEAQQIDNDQDQEDTWEGWQPSRNNFSRPNSSSSPWPSVVGGRKTRMVKVPPSELLPRYLTALDDEYENRLRNLFIEQMTKYKGPIVSRNEEFELNWIAIQDDLEQCIAEGLVPQDSIASTGLDETSYTDFKRCAEELQSNLYEGKLQECLSSLRGFRQLFSRSSDVVLKHAFRGAPAEVLQNIYYGGDGVLPEDRMQLDDPFHYEKNDDQAEMATTEVQKTSIQTEDVNTMGEKSQEAQQPDNDQDQEDTWVGWRPSRNKSLSPWPLMVGGRKTRMVKVPPSELLPRYFTALDDESENHLRDLFIEQMTKNQGPMVSRNKESELKWITIQDNLEQCIAEGLVPQDSIASTGLDETSFKDFKRCAEELQSNLYEGKLRECLSSLRGFRQLFSRSSDVVLKHAFRGAPAEVLQNIYYGGDGVLPEDRMQLDDPLHHEKTDDQANLSDGIKPTSDDKMAAANIQSVKEVTLGVSDKCSIDGSEVQQDNAETEEEDATCKEEQGDADEEDREEVIEEEQEDADEEDEQWDDVWGANHTYLQPILGENQPVEDSGTQPPPQEWNINLQSRGGPVAPNKEFELKWTSMEHELEQYIAAGLVPKDSVPFTGLSEDSVEDFRLCANELQNNLFEEKLLESLGNLRSFRKLFSKSRQRYLRNAFRGRPVEVLQNIYYGGDGTLPTFRMNLDDPFNYTREEKTMWDDPPDVCDEEVW